MGSVKHWMLAGTVLLGATGCGSDEVVVLLNIKNVTAEITTLQLALTLDGKPAPQQYEFTHGLGAVAIKLSKERLGQGKLRVGLNGLTSARCIGSTGAREVLVSAYQTLQEADVTLATISPAKCTHSFANDIYPAMKAACGSCHSLGGVAAKIFLIDSASAAITYSILMTKQLINTSMAATSKLTTVGGGGTYTPAAGGATQTHPATLPAAQRNGWETWIAKGAPP